MNRFWWHFLIQSLKIVVVTCAGLYVMNWGFVALSAPSTLLAFFGLFVVLISLFISWKYASSWSYKLFGETYHYLQLQYHKENENETKHSES